MISAFKFIFYLVVLFSVYHCKDRDETIQGRVIDIKFDYNILKNGKFVFDDPNFKKENIRLLYLKDGVWTEYYQAHLDAAYGYMFYNKDNHNYIRLFPYDYANDGHETFRIKYDDNTTDDIQAEFTYWKNGESLNKLWYNLKEFHNPTSSTFTIEK
ncbi:hypothetical protein ACK2M7_12060 [Chryseobacterium sp. TY4]